MFYRFIYYWAVEKEHSCECDQSFGGAKRGIPIQSQAKETCRSKTKGPPYWGYEYFYSELGAMSNALINKDSLASGKPNQIIETKAPDQSAIVRQIIRPAPG